MKKEIKIPWQGAILGIINIIILSAIIIGTVALSLAFLQAFVMSQNQIIAAAYLNVFSVTALSTFFVVIIETLLITGYFYGKKIAVLVGLIVAVIEIITNIVNSLFNLEMFLYNMVGLIFLGAVVWLNIFCLKHPFYGGNGKITLDTFKFWKKGKIVNSDDMTTF